MTDNSHLYRADAVRYAAEQGYARFRTVLNEDGTWNAKCVYGDGELTPAQHYAHGRDWVHHAEVELFGDYRVGVLVVSVTLPELAELGSTWHNEQGQWFSPEEGVVFLAEPLSRELWEPDPPAKKRRRRGKKDGEDAGSRVERPVETVHRIAGEMARSFRKDVIDACVAAGVNKSTAQTQYSQWAKKRPELDPAAATCVPCSNGSGVEVAREERTTADE